MSTRTSLRVPSDQAVRAGEDLLDALTWLRDQQLSTSSLELFLGRVEQIGQQLAHPNLVHLEPRRSVR